jgi:transposase
VFPDVKRSEMEDALLKTVIHTTPNNFSLLGHVWTTQLLADYLYQNHEVRVCGQTIRNILHKNNFSFKRAQKKTTKGVKSEQEAFKNNDRFSIYCKKTILKVFYT